MVILQLGKAPSAPKLSCSASLKNAQHVNMSTTDNAMETERDFRAKIMTANQSLGGKSARKERPQLPLNLRAPPRNWA